MRKVDDIWEERTPTKVGDVVRITWADFTERPPEIGIMVNESYKIFLGDRVVYANSQWNLEVLKDRMKL